MPGTRLHKAGHDGGKLAAVIEQSTSLQIPQLADCWVFHDNIAARRSSLSIAALQELWAASTADYASLPLFCAGNSKELRRTSVPGILIGRFLPTLYSYTSNRAGVVAGTDALRLRISRIFWRHLHRIGVKTCSLTASAEFVLVTEEPIPPVEVIVKRALIGTPAHIYHDLFGRRDRFGRPFVKGEPHPPYVRFDYRNPLTSETGERLRDEMLPEFLADRLIDTKIARGLALEITAAVDRLLNAAGFQLLDICLIFDRAGNILCGEISPDNMRIRSLESDAEFDKDLWRKNRSAEEITAQWSHLLSRLEAADAAD